MPRSVSSSIAATRACAGPSRLAMRLRSWLPSTQFGHASSGSTASYSSTRAASAAGSHGVEIRCMFDGICTPAP